MGYFNDAMKEKESLSHHGIRGQKWGVRRFQNANGTYTAAGKKRYGMDLDLNDKSRTNIAKIRKGEALRRLDVAKENAKNGKGSSQNVGDLKRKVKQAKRIEREMKGIDKGAKRYEKGETITGNRNKAYIAAVAATGASWIAANYLNTRITDLGNQGRLTPAHIDFAKKANTFINAALTGASVAYSAKKAIDNTNLRNYERSRWNGRTTVKRVGGEEYKDVIDRKNEAGMKSGENKNSKK